ncbi:MAG: tripartite tricarboxylate transporter substrate binding protein [Gemmobacter sp.]
MRHLIAATAIGLAAALPAFADYPSKPVSFIIPWPPGDLEDILTRLIADAFQAEHGVPAAVINRPGGGGGPFPGAIDVATAEADGHTIGSFVIDVPVIGHEIGIPELTPEKFDPVGIFLTYPFVIATGKDAPYSTMEELRDHARNNPVALGHFGIVATPTQVTMALSAQMGFEWGSDAAFDAVDCNTLASGDADVINTTIQLILPCLDQVKMLASITEERIVLAPDTPTVAEIAPDLALSTWNGLFVPKGTPEEVKATIAATAERVVLGEQAQRIAAETGALVYWKDAAASAERIAKDQEIVARIQQMIE